MSNGNILTNLFDTATGFVTDAAKFLPSIGQSINTIGSFFGRDTPLVGPSPQAITVSSTRPTENQSTGTTSQFAQGQGDLGMFNPQQAFIGGLPSLVGAASRVLRNPIGQVGIGTGVGAGLSQLTTMPGQPRITRRMRSEVRRLLMVTGGNFALVSQFMNQSGKYPRINFTPQILMMVLIKRFRNDGPFVTKAAIRKTRSTVRKLKSMQNLLKDVTTMRATRRRSTTGTRGSSNVLIKN